MRPSLPCGRFLTAKIDIVEVAGIGNIVQRIGIQYDEIRAPGVACPRHASSREARLARSPVTMGGTGALPETLRMVIRPQR